MSYTYKSDPEDTGADDPAAADTPTKKSKKGTEEEEDGELKEFTFETMVHLGTVARDAPGGAAVEE